MMKKLFLSGKYNIENNKNKEKNNDIINTKEEKEKNTITQIELSNGEILKIKTY